MGVFAVGSIIALLSGVQSTATPSLAIPDIVVEGELDVPDGNPSTAVRPSDLSAMNPAQTIVANRVKLALAQRVAACVLRGRLSPLSQLRAVVDGKPNMATQRLALRQLKLINVTCGESASLAGMDEGANGTIYDYGALMMETIRTYAPTLKLTRAETYDPAVQSRFNLREVPRNRARLPLDRRYFEVAVCLVRMQPTLASRLVMRDLPPKEVGRFEAAIVDGAPICVGNADKVTFDPTQFRIYIADAVYRWTIAARNVYSLIPAD